jgi:hypothetical protein
MNEHNTNKHGSKDECEWEDEQWVCMRERGNVREERTQTTCMHELSPPHHAHPLTTHVNRATVRAISGSGDDNTIVTTPIAPL